MNEQLRFFPLFIITLLFTFCAVTETAQAQGAEEQPGPSEPNAIPARAYTFQMLLKPGTDLDIEVKGLSTKENSSPEEVGALSAPPIATSIHRNIRQGIIRVAQGASGTNKELVRYYVEGWCAYDDPRRGLNVRRPNIDGLIFPMDFYHFPELLWAEPRTRQPDPIVKDGEPKIHLYKDGDQTLEVDAASGLPLRFSDGSQEWIYSCKENSTPLVVPEKLMTALRKVLQK